MGISPTIYLINGIRLTKKEAKILDRVNFGEIVMEWVDRSLEVANEVKDGDKKHDIIINRWDYMLNSIVARTKKGKVTRTTKPKWHGKKKHISELKTASCPEDFDYILRNLGYLDPLAEKGPDPEWSRFVEDSMFVDIDEGPLYCIGFESSSVRTEGVVWAIANTLKANSKDKFIVQKGTHPWETSITEHQGKWFMFNAHALVSGHDEETIELKKPIWKDKNELIQRAKEIYKKYTKHYAPYKNYPNEVWSWSYTTMFRVDMLYQAICRVCPEIKYDFERIERFLYIKWW